MMGTMGNEAKVKGILEIGNWAPPVCSWSMSLVGLRKELDARGWDCRVMNLNEKRRVRSTQYIDVQNGWDYVRKVLRTVREGYAVHTRVNGESADLYVLALVAMLAARFWRRPALLTYGGGHRQTYFPAPRLSLRHLARSEEHTSELQSRLHLVCRLLLEKKNNNTTHPLHFSYDDDTAAPPYCLEAPPQTHLTDCPSEHLEMTDSETRPTAKTATHAIAPH